MAKAGLSSTVGIGRIVGLTFAVIAPASSVFLTFATGFDAAGTGIVLGYAIGALINLAIMLGYAEVGSRHPEAGGDYSLAARALGRRAGSVYTVVFFVKGMAIPALLALTTALYAHQLWPRLPTTGLGFLILLAFVVLGSLDVRTSSTVVTAMVAMECLVFLLFLIAAVHQLHQPVWMLWHPMHRTSHGMLASTPARAWLRAAIAALYGLNGPQACLYYSEETDTAPKQFGRTIVLASLTTIFVELGAVAVGVLALPRLHGVGTLPLAAMVRANLGPTGGRLLLIAITIALFDTGLATLMSYSRIFFAMARDRQWPRPLNGLMRHVNRQGVPTGALAFLVATNVVVMALSGVHVLVNLGGSLLIIVYGGIAWAGLKTRFSAAPPPYRMPWWPIPPLLALGGLALLTFQLDRPTRIISILVLLLGLAWSSLAPQAG